MKNFLKEFKLFLIITFFSFAVLSLFFFINRLILNKDLTTILRELSRGFELHTTGIIVILFSPYIASLIARFLYYHFLFLQKIGNKKYTLTVLNIIFIICFLGTERLYSYYEDNIHEIYKEKCSDNFLPVSDNIAEVRQYKNVPWYRYSGIEHAWLWHEELEFTSDTAFTLKSKVFYLDDYFALEHFLNIIEYDESYYHKYMMKDSLVFKNEEDKRLRLSLDLLPNELIVEFVR